jgi:hypothetical protein
VICSVAEPGCRLGRGDAHRWERETNAKSTLDRAALRSAAVRPCRLITGRSDELTPLLRGRWWHGAARSSRLVGLRGHR